MLNVGKLVVAPGVGRYYVEQVAGGRGDYYAGEGEAAGYWMGSAAAALAVSGEVTMGGLTRLLAAQDSKDRRRAAPGRTANVRSLDTT